MFTYLKCGQTFLRKKGYEPHAREHQQTHIDSWGLQEQENEKQTYDISDMPGGLNRQSFKCVYRRMASSLVRWPVGRKHKLTERLKWLEKR